MSEDLNELIKLQGSYVGRAVSPILEASTARAIENAVRELVESKYLYQKVALDWRAIQETVKPLAAKLPNGPTERISGKAIVEWGNSLPSRLEVLRAEVEQRPWTLATRHQGDNPAFAEVRRVASSGTSPIGTPVEQMPITFYLPAVQIICGGTCKRQSVFSAHVSSSAFSLETLHPKLGNKGLEQVYHTVYRCEVCRSMVYNILIQRVGARLHLCGFAPRREPFTTRLVSDALHPILSDAEQAVAEGDVFAAFYHLRTMLEHYLKMRQRIPFTDQVRGEDLIMKHYDGMAVSLRSVLPSISDAYTDLSKMLHARVGEVEDFQRLRDRICDHIDMLATMERSGGLV